MHKKTKDEAEGKLMRVWGNVTCPSKETIKQSQGIQRFKFVATAARQNEKWHAYFFYLTNYVFSITGSYTPINFANMST